MHGLNPSINSYPSGPKEREGIWRKRGKELEHSLCVKHLAKMIFLNASKKTVSQIFLHKVRRGFFVYYCTEPWNNHVFLFKGAMEHCFRGNLYIFPSLHWCALIYVLAICCLVLKIMQVSNLYQHENFYVNMLSQNRWFKWGMLCHYDCSIELPLGELI